MIPLLLIVGCASAYYNVHRGQFEHSMTKPPVPIEKLILAKRAAAPEVSLNTTFKSSPETFAACVGNETVTDVVRTQLCQFIHNVFPHELARMRAEIKPPPQSVLPVILAGCALFVLIAMWRDEQNNRLLRSSPGNATRLYFIGSVHNECLVCLDKPTVINALADCGHTGICDGCLPQLDVCPVCRTENKSTIRLSF